MMSLGPVMVEGFLKIHDPDSKEVFVDKHNAIHYENMSIALAESIANKNIGYIYAMAFGHGGSSVDPTGVITYLPPNVTGQNADLYNQTYIKVVDGNSPANTDPTRNFTETRHTTGTNYSDVFVTCLLDYGEPSGQAAYDTNTDGIKTFVFDELGLQSYSKNGTPLLLTHVVFHPVLKSLNRLIQIDYTVRIQSLTGLVGV
jgi:hypothetical protein